MHRIDVHVIALEVDFDKVVVGLQKRFGLPKSTAERFLKDLPRVARYQADVEQANAYKRVLSEVGVRVVLRPSGSSVPQTDVPSLPVPAHGPSGITNSMRTFASSARLANRVPPAPALPQDLTGPHQIIDFEGDDESAPPAELNSIAVHDSSRQPMEFQGLSSPPGAREAARQRSINGLDAVSKGAAETLSGSTSGGQVTRRPEASRSTPGRLLLAGSLLLLGVVAFWIAQSM